MDEKQWKKVAKKLRSGWVRCEVWQVEQFEGIYEEKEEGHDDDDASLFEPAN